MNPWLSFVAPILAISSFTASGQESGLVENKLKSRVVEIPLPSPSRPISIRDINEGNFAWNGIPSDDATINFNLIGSGEFVNVRTFPIVGGESNVLQAIVFPAMEFVGSFPILVIDPGEGGGSEGSGWISNSPGSGGDISFRIGTGAGTKTVESPAAPKPIFGLDRKVEAITKITPLANGAFRLAGTGNAGLRYAVEASTDLVSWNEIGSAANQLGALGFNDLEAKPRARRYYRLKQRD
jgi:hypothetical protein